MNKEQIYAIGRPHANLLKYYLITSLMTGPGFFIMFPLMYFRYHTLHYQFDDEGITMRWGILFRREIHLTYARIQDIHLTSGLLQRWLKIASIQIQTASGSSAAEMVIEGLMEYEGVRDFLYTKMRGYKPAAGVSVSTPLPAPASVAGTNDAEAIDLLKNILGEMKGAREALDNLSIMEGGDNV